jgi:hypothetical protein
MGLAVLIASAVSPIHTSPLEAARKFAGGMVAAPAIGALIGYIARRFNKLSLDMRLVVALLDLYLATYLFQLANGMGQFLAQFLRSRADYVQRSLVIDPFLGTLLGLTYTGLVLGLFPLSYLNHVLIGKVWDHVQPRSSGEQPAR